MKGFENVFGIRIEHRLELVRSRSRGGVVRGEYFDHEEFDSRGNLIARYESFSEIDPVTRTAHRGWYRYDAEGFLTDRHDDIPEPIGDALAG